MRVELTASEIKVAVKAALAEDIGGGDVTTLATVPETATARAVMRAREPLVVAGLDFAAAAFNELIERFAPGSSLTFNLDATNGLADPNLVEAGSVLQVPSPVPAVAATSATSCAFPSPSPSWR